MPIKIILGEKVFSLAIFFSSLILYPDVPPWAFASAMIFWIWRFLVEYFEFPVPSRFLTGFISVLFFLATYYSFRSLVGKEASTCFLLILSSLKFLEYREDSEKNFLVLLGFFLICAKFLFSLDLIYALIEIPLFFILLFSLLPREFQKKPWRFRFRILGSSILVALPLTFFLYVFFPRFSQSWVESRSARGQYGITGIADEVYPGSVAKLLESNEVAFRAEFNAVRPRLHDLYWRGEVFNLPQGFRWKKGLHLKSERYRENAVSENNWNVRMTLEPHFRNWLFILEGTYALKSEQNSIYKNTASVFTSQFPTEKRSILWARWEKPNGLPADEEDFSPKNSKVSFSENIQNLISEISHQKTTPEEFADILLEYFPKNHFRYTLKPGDQGTLTLDDFIFKTKKGFCEHYASAAALLFRAAGFQARVVAGYQGGSFNRFGNFWTIQQKDAHAWMEYLDSKKMWQRFDLTSVIAPLRLELGATSFLNLGESERESLDAQSLRNLSSKESWLSQIDFWFENLNYRWNTLLLDYDLEKQKELLRGLEIKWGELALLALVLALISYFILNLLSRKPNHQAHKIIFARLQSFFSSYSLERKSHEGPRDWSHRIVSQFPKEHELVEEVFQCYIQEAYARNSTDENLKKTKKLLRRLRTRINVRYR